MNREDSASLHLSTRTVHAGEERIKFAKSLVNPIAQTATYIFESLEEFEAFKAGEGESYEYGRYGNPTQRTAEKKIAALEGAEEGLLLSSGMSAVTTTLLAMLRSGQHLVVLGDVYRMTVKFGKIIEKFGIQTTQVDAWDWEGLERAVRPETRILFTESPTNPHLRVIDLERLVAFAQKHRLKVVIDSTFATPINQRPLEFGVDLVIHSATKYLGGHNDLVAGGVFGAREMVDAIREFQRVTGSLVDPMTSFLLIRGLKTLALRIKRQNETALEMARFLNGHPAIKKVYYPGLDDHPDHQVAERLMEGYGGVVSFDIDGDLNRTRRFVQMLKIPYLAPSLGGVESLATHPATMSFYDLNREERIAIGINDELVRYAVGIEEGDDLIADLEEALKGIKD